MTDPERSGSKTPGRGGFHHQHDTARYHVSGLYVDWQPRGSGVQIPSAPKEKSGVTVHPGANQGGNCPLRDRRP